MVFDIITSTTQTKILAEKVINKYQYFKHFTIKEISEEAGCVIDTKKLELCFKHAVIQIKTNVTITEDNSSNISIVGQLFMIEPNIVAEYYLDNIQTVQGVESIVELLKRSEYKNDT